MHAGRKINTGREINPQITVFCAIRVQTKGANCTGRGSKGRKIKCLCIEKCETIKIRKIQRGKEGMSC